jgi:hypothetical protein
LQTAANFQRVSSASKHPDAGNVRDALLLQEPTSSMKYRNKQIWLWMQDVPPQKAVAFDDAQLKFARWRGSSKKGVVISIVG